MKAFDDTPDKQICTKVQETINVIKNPHPPKNPPYLTEPNDHFIFFREPIDYPEDLYNLAHEGNISSGWIKEIECFWAANCKVLIFFTSDLKHISQSLPIDSPVISSGYIDGFIVVSLSSGLELVSFPSFESIKSTYSMPKNISVTLIRHGVAGCNDGSLRSISVNPPKKHISVSGIISLSEDDPVVQIIPTQNYLVSLTLSSTISFFSKKHLTSIATLTDLKNIIYIWCNNDDFILAMDANTVVYRLSYRLGFIRIDDQQTCQLLKRWQFQSAIFEHGFLTAVDSSRPSFDAVMTARFTKFPVYTINQRLGGVHSIGSTENQIKLFASSGVYSLTEQLTTDINEEIWKFTNLILKYWNTPISELPDTDSQLYADLMEYFHSNYQALSSLSSYIIDIIDDTQVLKDTNYEALKSPLSELFGPSRTRIFSWLRKLSFNIRYSNKDQVEPPQDELSELITLANGGNQKAANQALNLIVSSYKTVPSNFPYYLEFMLNHGFYRELLESANEWADSVLSQPEAIAFENANFPQADIETVQSYQIRLRIYEQMIPLLERAVGIHGNTIDKEAADAVKYALNFRNTVFQRYVLRFLEEHCPSNIITDFTYPEMIAQMKDIKSRHLSIILLHHGLKEKAFNYYLMKATGDASQTCPLYSTSDEDKYLSIEKRIGYLHKALDLCPDDEKAKQLMEIARLLGDFISNNPQIPQNLFSLDFIEIKDQLVSSAEYLLALKIMKIFNEKRGLFSILEKYIQESSPAEFDLYIHDDPIFTQYEVAKTVYELKGKQAFDFMFDARMDNLYIFKLLCELWRNGQLRDDAHLIVHVLDRAGPVNETIRNEVADLLCDIILDFDARNGQNSDTHAKEDARIIRENLENCFLEQRFIDINDL